MEDYTRQIIPEASEQTVEIEGMRGTVYEGMVLGSKIFTIDVILSCESERDRVLKLRDLSNFFVQMMDGQEYPLIFDDEQDVVWYVHPTDVSNPERIARTSHDVKFTITFKCSSGTGEGRMYEKQLTKTTTKLTPKGNTTTYPVFTFVGKKQTKIGISNGSEYVYLGKGFDVENQDAPINLRPRILNDSCTTLATWTKLTSSDTRFNIENGVISDDADIRTTGKALAVTQIKGEDNFGKAVSGSWHGPARIQWLTKACDDWEVSTRMYVNNKYPRARGKIELYLLDINGKRIGKFMVKDNDESLTNTVQVQLGYDSNGTHKEIYLSSNDATVSTKKGSTAKKEIKYKEKVKVTKTDKKGKKTTTTETVTKTLSLPQDLTTNTYTDFYGTMTLKKQGNKYTATVQLLDTNGNPVGKLRTATYTDSSNQFGDKLAGVAIYLAKWDITEDTSEVAKTEYKENTLQLSDVKVWELIGETNQFVVDEGDEIIINCSNQTVTKNGTAFMENVYIGSEFFEMTGGIETAFSLSPKPSNENEWYVTYKERYN